MARNTELQTFRDQEVLPSTVTASATELNILDGVTATYAELNILDGVTATAAEINKLDGFSPLGINNSEAQVSKTDDYTATLAEAGTRVDFGAASGKTFTIPANASVAFPIGTIIIVSKSGANNLTLAITSDTLIGSTTLSATTACLLVKIAATQWIRIG